MREPKHHPERSNSSLLLAGAALIVFATCLAYLPAMHGGFLWDDDELLTNNALVKAPDGLYRLWCTDQCVDYWPATYTSFWIEWRLWGMNPTGYHVTNLALHIAAALLIWAILRQLSIPGAYLAALLFAVHPVNVESVAWIAQRKNTLAMFFFLLAILWYLPAIKQRTTDDEQRTGWWYGLSLAAFLLAMLSKGSVATLPIVLLLLVWWQRRRINLADLLRTAPFFLVAAILAGVNIWFQTHGTGEVLRTASFAQRLAGAGGTVWFYLSKALVPIDLIFVYPQWQIQTSQALWWLPVLAALSVSALLWRYRNSPSTKWGRALLLAWGFFCLALLPVMGFADVFFMKYSLVADHYQYLSLIGVTALAAAAWSYWRQHARTAARWAPTAAAAIVVGTLTLMSWQQSRMYGDILTLYQTTIDKNPTCWLAYHNLGIVLARAGRTQEALQCFQRTLALNPDYDLAHNDLGNVLMQTGQVQEAIAHYQKAVQIKPNFALAHYNLGNALLSSGRPQEAIEEYRHALAIDHDNLEVLNNLGISLVQVGQLEEAVEQFKQAVRLEPKYLDAYTNLTKAYAQLQRPVEAIAAAQKALELARARGQSTLAEQIESWLQTYRAEHSQAGEQGPASQGASLRP